jgi:hypothetical protein
MCVWLSKPTKMSQFGGSVHRLVPVHGLAEACYIRAVPKPPPRLKVQRAKVIVTDAGVKRLTECESCGEEKYIAEGQTVCDECKARPKRKLPNEKQRVNRR